MSEKSKAKVVRQKVFKTGNSLVVAVPASFCRAMDVEAGDSVEVQTDRDKHKITYQFSPPRQLSLIEEE